MAIDRPRAGWGRADDAAKPGMGMNETTVLGCDQQVNLRRPWADQNEVSRFHSAFGRFKSAELRAFESGVGVGLAHRVATGTGRRATDGRQRQFDQPDAIDTAFRVAAPEAKWRAKQAFSRSGEARPFAGHALAAG